MALTLKLSSNIINYTSLNLTDITGEYDIVTNPTGWGGTNPTLPDVSIANLIVTLPNASVVVVDIVGDLGIDFSGATSADLVYNLTSTLLYGTDGVLPDGVYNISYNIFDGVDQYTTTVNIMTYYNVQKSVYDRIQLIPQYYTCSDCNNQFVKETSTIFMLLQALIASSQYSNTVRFEELLAGLTDIMSFDTINTSSCGC